MSVSKCCFLPFVLMFTLIGGCQHPQTGGDFLGFSSKPAPPMSKLLPIVTEAHLLMRDGDTIVFHGCRTASISEKLPALLQKCTPIPSKPDHIPEQFRYLLSIQYKGMNPTADQLVHLRYYPKEHLLSYNPSHETDSWAKTTQELDELLKEWFDFCEYDYALPKP